MPPLSFIVGDRDLTREIESLSFSNTDPGGFEMLQAEPRSVSGLRPGTRITVRSGLDVAWDGRLNEPGEHSKHTKRTSSIAALGYGARLKDNPLSMIYVDRDLSGWHDMSTAARTGWIASSSQVHPFTTAPDVATGLPALITTLTGAWSQRAACEAWYDAGPGNLIAAVYYDFLPSANIGGAPSVSWHWSVLVSVDDAGTGAESSGELRAGSGSGYFTPVAHLRYARLQHYYDVAAGSGGTNYDLAWRKPALYGDHGLTRRGSDPGGFYPSDIAVYALDSANTGIALGVVETASGLIVPHAVYKTPVDRERHIDDMAKLMGWHWGVWEPTTILDDTPTFHFRSPPPDATVVVSRSELDDLDAPKVRLDTLYDTAKVAYRDPAGSQGIVTVTLSNPLLDQTGEGPRTLTLDMGVGSAAAAQDYGAFALALTQTAARGGGSCIVPDTVRLAGGGSKPACLLKSGRDRIRIIDLPDSGPWTETNTRRYDTFRVKRVETTVQKGVPQTRVEFDGGADLLEVLQARFAIGAQIVGV